MKPLTRRFRVTAMASMVSLLFIASLGMATAQGDGSAAYDEGDQTAGTRGGFRGQLVGEFTARLAHNLGVSEDQLRSALRQTVEEMRPLVGGQIERLWERFRTLRGRMEEGSFERDGRGRPGLGARPFDSGVPGRPGGPLGPGLGVPPRAVVGSLAQAAGLPPEALQEDLRAGKTLAQIAQEHGIAPDALADQLTERAEQFRIQRIRAGILRFLNRPLLLPRAEPEMPESSP